MFNTFVNSLTGQLKSIPGHDHLPLVEKLFAQKCQALHDFSNGKLWRQKVSEFS